MEQRTQAVASLLCFYAVCAGMTYNRAAVLLQGPPQQGPPQHHSSVSHPDQSSTEEAPVMSRTDSSVNSSVVLHDYMLFVYQTLSTLQHRHTDNHSLSPANTVTSFVDRGQDQPLWDEGQRYVFDLSTLSTEEEEEVVEAELRILRRKPSPPPDLLNLNLHRLLLYSCSPAEGSAARQPLASRVVGVGAGGLPGWEVFDVTAALKLFLKDRQRRRSLRDAPWQQELCLHLLVVSEVTETAVDPLTLGLGRRGRPPGQRALLVAFSSHRRGDGGGPTAAGTEDPLFREISLKVQQNVAAGTLGLHKPRDTLARHGHGPRGRQRRTAAAAQRSNRSFGGGGGGGGGGGEEAGVGGAAAGVSGGNGGNGAGGRKRNRCGRRPLRVNFKDLGWDDWIIAPLDYEAHHCEGACDFPLRSHLEPTNHAIIQTFMHSMEPPRPQGGAGAAATTPAAVPASCCVPSRLSPISILYIDGGNNVVYKQYEDMVVESCGCR